MNVLIVEDDGTYRTLLKKRLGDIGCEVDAETNAFGAISILGWKDYDCVILDYELPQYSGCSIERMIKIRGVPACYFTAHKASDIADKCTLPIIEKTREGLAELLIFVNACKQRHHAYA